MMGASAGSGSLCNVHISKVEGVKSTPLESLAEATVSEATCKAEAMSQMKSICEKIGMDEKNLKAKYDFFDSVKFGMKKGELFQDCKTLALKTAEK